MSGLSLRARLTGIPLHRLLLFLDYDGTLTPIVRRPAQARLSESVRHRLRLLAQWMPLVIVSGRELSDLRRKVRLPSVRYVASHGLFYQEPGFGLRCLGRPVARETVRQWVRAWTAAADGIPGALVEDKQWSVALHDRLVASSDRHRLRRRALQAFKMVQAQGGVTLLRGKHVLEMRPAGGWNKGTAVEALLQEPWAAGRTAIYLGDDRTDFDAIAAVRSRGLGVRVGGRRGAAGEDAWVAGPDAVASFLGWLVERGRRGGAPLLHPLSTAPPPFRPVPSDARPAAGTSARRKPALPSQAGAPT